MASNWTVCGVCEYRHITKQSVVWCSECDEGLCEECKEHHGVSKGTRSHGIESITEYQTLPYNVLQLASSCEKHNEKYMIFCKKHDCPCCKKCVVESHIECKELIDVNDITRNIKSSHAFEDIEHTLTEMALNIKRLRINREDNLALIEKQSKEIEKRVIETRARINFHLDKLQNVILKDLKTREEEESNKIRRLLKSLLDKDKENTEHQTNIAYIKQYASELQAFLALKHIEKNVVAEEKNIQSMVKSDAANQVEFSCQTNPSLQGLLSSIQNFGDIVVKADQCKIPILKQKERQAQMMLPVTPMTIDNVTPILLKKFRKRLLDIFGCTFLPDCRTVLACLSKKIIQVFKLDGSLDFEIRNIGPVFDVTYIGDNSVAVTSGYYKPMEISLIDLTTKKVKKTLKLDSFNAGVTYSDDNLIYCAAKDGIQMINLHNEAIVSVTKTKLPYYSYVATFRDNIYYTGGNDHNVTCIDFQGNMRWVFKNKSVLRFPLGISVDRDGNVYVVGQGLNNVVVISPNGQNYRQLLTSENGLNDPLVLHVDRSRCCKMLVANEMGQAFVFNL